MMTMNITASIIITIIGLRSLTAMRMRKTEYVDEDDGTDGR